MKLTDTSIARPVTIAMVAVGLLVFGLVGVTRMPVDIYPQMTIPMVIVGTIYPGAGPQEIESSITLPLEKQLGSTPNLKDMSSRSVENVSVITLQFEWGANLDAASADVRDRLAIAGSGLPAGAQTPFVLKLNTSMMPIAQYTLTGDMDNTQLRELADDFSTLLQRVPGVASVSVSGGAVRQVHIDVDARELADAGVTNEQLMATLQAQNLNYPVGSISSQGRHILLRLVGQYDDVEQIRNTVIGMKGTTPVLLRSVARVEWGPEEVTSYARYNGKPCIYITIQRRPDANTIRVAQGAREMMTTIQSTLPAGAHVNLIFDGSDQIKQSINNVASNIIIGGILAVMILFLFLRRLRATTFVAFSIPISIFFAVFFMYIFGFSINILSMAGLAIAVGMVVDNGIVAFESIFRHREEGDEPFRAASVGTNEIAMAITASTLTTIVVFLPMLLMRGLLLIFFRELVWAVVGSLTASLAVALTLIPMLSSRFLKMKAPGTKERGLQAWSERMYMGLEATYGRLIGWAVGHRRLVVISSVVLLVGTLGLIPRLRTEFMPFQTNFYHQLTAEMPIGTSVEATDSAVSKLEQYIMQNWQDDVEGTSVQVGTPVGGGLSSLRAIFGGASNSVASVNLILKSTQQRKHSIDELDAAIRAKASEIPGLKVFAAANMAASFMGGGNNIEVDIVGHDLATADSLTEKVVAAMNAIPGLTDVKSSREPGNPEIEFTIDRQKAALYGLTPYQVGAALNTQITGYAPTVFRTAGKEYDMLVRLRRDQRTTPEAIENLTVNGPMGPVPLKNLTSSRTGSGPLDIEHENTERVVRITAQPVGLSTGQAAQRILAALHKIPTPPGFEITLSGSYKDMMKSFGDLGLIVLIALMLVFMVMASQFESFRDPFIIMFTVPFALIGVLWTLFLTGTALSVTSGLGVLVLVGIVVNNGIVYIDYCNQLRHRGIGLIEAVKEAGRVRLRPILMTSLTTIFGLIPLALQIGEGSELWSPLGRAIIGGMVVSTFLPLLFIPVLYVIFETRSERRRVRKATEAATPRDAEATGQ
jgi:hydrophobic/amphiphilic exporter-1 (mainly G- bacteria), HAE1 family